MLYTFFGTDIEKIRTRSSALIETLKTKRAEASFFRLHRDSFTTEKIHQLTGSIGLFSSKYIVMLDNVCTGISEDGASEAAEKIDFLLNQLSVFKSSDHIWIIVEDSHFGASSGKDISEKQQKLLHEIHIALKKNSDKIEEHVMHEYGTHTIGNSLSLVKKDQHITSFVFTDAFFSNQKLKAIESLNVLKKQGGAAEEVHGALWWQTKVLIQVMKKQTKGVSPFVIKKTDGFTKRFSVAKAEELVGLVVDMYHKAHLGEVDLYSEMERLAFRV